MKRLIFLISMIFLFSCSGNEKNVKMISDSRYSVEDNFGKAKKGELEIKKISNYNVSGKILEEAAYLSDGSLYSKFIYQYDENDTLIEVKETDFDGNIKYTETISYDTVGNKLAEKRRDNKDKIISYSKFDTKGNLVEKRTFKGDFVNTIINKYDSTGYKMESNEYYSTTTYTYDDDGNMKKYTSFDNYGNLQGKNEYWYDAKGNIIGEIFYEVDGSEFSKELYKYDGSGNQIERSWYGSTGKLYYTTYYKFDKTGNKISEKSRMGRYSYKYKYNSSGNKIEQKKIDEKGNLEDKIVISYNNEGDKIEETKYDSDGKITSNTKFDSLGNITENRWVSYKNEDRKTNYKYNVEGLLEERIHYIDNDSIISVELYTYDELGRKIAKSELEWKSLFKYNITGNITEAKSYYVSGNLFNTLVYTYNDSGKLIKKEWVDTDNLPNSKYTYKYNNSGQMIEEKEYLTFLKSTYTSLYTDYDKSGNWLKKEVYNDDKLVEIYERDIKYY